MDTALETRDPTPVHSITIKSTLPPIPLPRTSIPAIIQTPRLTLRAYQADDLAPLCALRSQPEVMIFTGSGAPESRDKTRQFLEVRLAQQQREDNDGRLEYAICLRENGEWMGFCGIQPGLSFAMGWPSLGYQIRSEFWGRGYGTEAVAAVVAAWWALERCEREVCVESSTVQIMTDKRVRVTERRGRECVAAVTVEENLASRRVLEKCGFALAKVWEEADLRDRSRMVRLFGYVARAQ